MIVSDNTNRSNSRWLQACVLLCAMVVLPVGIASAQDYKAVERRLGEAVSNGELSLEQAGLMMAALKKEAAKSKSDTNLESIWKKLQAMVKTGELTEEQANAKMSAIKKEAAKKDQDSDRTKAYLMKVRKELGAAVEADRISKEDAAKRYEAAKKGIQKRMAAGRSQRGSKRITREDYARAEAELRKAVAESKISGEDARARLAGMRKMIGEKSEGATRKITREDYARAEAELKKAVAEGRISKEDLRARLNGMRRAMAEQGERQRGGERQRTTREDRRAEYEGFERRIKAAVAEGKMTPKQAREKLEAYRKSMGQRVRGQERRGNENADVEAYLEIIRKRLKEAVEAGDLSEEEAKAKYEDIKKEEYEKAKAGEQGERRRLR